MCVKCHLECQLECIHSRTVCIHLENLVYIHNLGKKNNKEVEKTNWVFIFSCISHEHVCNVILIFFFLAYRDYIILLFIYFIFFLERFLPKSLKKRICVKIDHRMIRIASRHVLTVFKDTLSLRVGFAKRKSTISRGQKLVNLFIYSFFTIFFF